MLKLLKREIKVRLLNLLPVDFLSVFIYFDGLYGKIFYYLFTKSVFEFWVHTFLLIPPTKNYG